MTPPTVPDSGHFLTAEDEADPQHHDSASRIMPWVFGGLIVLLALGIVYALAKPISAYREKRRLRHNRRTQRTGNGDADVELQVPPRVYTRGPRTSL